MRTERVAAIAVVLTCAATQARADAAGMPERTPADALRLEAQAAQITSNETVAAIESVAARARRLLGRARSRGEVVPARCADEALTRADVGSRRARDEAAAVQAAYARNDVDAAHLGLLRLSLLRDAVRSAGASMDVCCDPEGSAISGTQVRVINAPAPR